MMRSVIALLLVGLLAACTDTDVPFGMERLGALPPDRYAALERLTASAKPEFRTTKEASATTSRPEPFWVYSVDPGVRVRGMPLQIGQFTGLSPRANEVAVDLRQRLVEELGNAHIFSAISTEPIEGSLVLDGVVVRAGTITPGTESVARTQMELTLRQNGQVVGAIQLNSPLLNYNSLLPVGTALFSLVSGSRVGALAASLNEVFAALAEGKSEGIETHRFIKRYIFVAPQTQGPS